jgi:hypothetical protein
MKKRHLTLASTDRAGFIDDELVRRRPFSVAPARVSRLSRFAHSSIKKMLEAAKLGPFMPPARYSTAEKLKAFRDEQVRLAVHKPKRAKPTAVK